MGRKKKGAARKKASAGQGRNGTFNSNANNVTGGNMTNNRNVSADSSDDDAPPSLVNPHQAGNNRSRQQGSQQRQQQQQRPQRRSQPPVSTVSGDSSDSSSDEESDAPPPLMSRRGSRDNSSDSDSGSEDDESMPGLVEREMDNESSDGDSAAPYEGPNNRANSNSDDSSSVESGDNLPDLVGRNVMGGSSDEDSSDDNNVPGLTVGDNSSGSESESDAPNRKPNPSNRGGFARGFLNQNSSNNQGSNRNTSRDSAAETRRQAQQEAETRKAKDKEDKRKRNEARQKKAAEKNNKAAEKERKKKEAAERKKKEQEERKRLERLQKEEEARARKEKALQERLQREKEEKSRQVIRQWFVETILARRLRTQYRKQREVTIEFQALVRKYLARIKYSEELQARIESSKEYRKTWGKLEEYVQKKLPEYTEYNWEDAMKRFDKMNVLDDGDEKLANEEELESAIQTLDSAIQTALEEKVEDAQPPEDDANDVAVELEEIDEEQEADTLPEGVTALPLPPAHKIDQIQVSKDVLKWFNRQDAKYASFFIRRICQLADGERSRILKKHLTGTKTAIWETYLDQKSGQRILWTECETYHVNDHCDGKSRIDKGILIWYVAKHDDVNRLMIQIDKAENRSSEKLESALTFFTDRHEDLLQLDDRNRILADPLGDTPLKLHLLYRQDIRKLSSKEWKPRLHLTAEELEVVNKEGTVLVLGRSGTGKTICIANRMDLDRGEEGEKKVTQLFVARSRRICSYVRGLVDGSNTSKEGVEYLTFAKFVDKCERVFNIKKRKHASDWGDSLDPNQMTFAKFKLDVYDPKKFELDALIVWSQIRSFIKGSVEAVKAGRPLTREEYMDLGKSRCRLAPDQRKQAYSAFEAYRSFLESEPELWDDTDRIFEILLSIHKASVEGDEETLSKLSFEKVYVDEIQDYTQAEIALYFYLGKPGGLFLAGDTAQSVVEGVDFRFEEVRSIAFTLFQGDDRYMPDKPVTVNVNFRSHSGILNVAAGVLDRMFKAFPKSANTLEPDIGCFSGPRPSLLPNLSQQTLKELVDLIDGVVLLTHDEHVQDLKQLVGPDTLVFGIRYSKGLEFPHVVIVDFFSCLQDDHQNPWRKLLTIRSGQDVAMEDLKDKAPEVETQLKLLYTAITRCSKRLFFAETKNSVAGNAFNKWCTVMEKPLAVVQTVDNVERLKKTADEWAASGINFGMEADNSEDLEQSKMWLKQAKFDFQKANSNELIERSTAHLNSVEFQMDIRTKIRGSESRLAKEDEEQAANIVLSLLENSLVNQASLLMKNMVLNHVPEYNKTRLLKEVTPHIPRPQDD